MPSSSLIQEWTEAAPFWDLHRDLIGQMWSPVNHALRTAADLSPGQTVLDVATGPGDPALNFAPLLGPRGNITGIDLVPAMVSSARREAARLGLDNARFEVAAAEALPFADRTFDAAVSRFGVMFFPSPEAGIRDMLRVLKPGGKLALSVWHRLDQNPFFRVVERCLELYIPPGPPQPDALHSFRFATQGPLLRILRETGVAHATEQLLRFDMHVPVAVEEFWTLRCGMSDKLRGLLATLSAENRAEVKRQALEDVLAWKTDGGFIFPGEVLVLSGEKA